jgi:hypothetical protein
MIPKKPAAHLMRGGYRFPACAKPVAPVVVWLDASAGEGRSDKIMHLKRDTDFEEKSSRVSDHRPCLSRIARPFPRRASLAIRVTSAPARACSAAPADRDRTTSPSRRATEPEPEAGSQPPSAMDLAEGGKHIVTSKPRSGCQSDIPKHGLSHSHVNAGFPRN